MYLFHKPSGTTQRYRRLISDHIRAIVRTMHYSEYIKKNHRIVPKLGKKISSSWRNFITKFVKKYKNWTNKQLIHGKWPTWRTILFYVFISIFYIFRATLCSSSGSFPTCIRNGHRHRVTYTRCCIDTIDSPDDEHEVARKM